MTQMTFTYDELLQNCDVLAGEWSSVRCLDKPKRTLPLIQEKLSF